MSHRPKNIILAISLLLNLVVVVFYVGPKFFGRFNSTVQNAKALIGFYEMRRTFLDHSPLPQKGIVMLGDSIVEGGLWNEYFPAFRVYNRGLGGDSLAGVAARLEPVLGSRPEKLFILIGVNDLFRGQTVMAVSAQYESLLEKIRDLNQGAEIFIQSILPINPGLYGGRLGNAEIREVNRNIQKLAERFRVTWIDLQPTFSEPTSDYLKQEFTYDGIHLTAAGYKAWSELLKLYVD